MRVSPSGRLTYAIRRSDNAMVGVLDVKKGLRCDCFCPQCRACLIARQGPQRIHFAHWNGGGHGCGPGAWHTTLAAAFASLDEIDFGPRAPIMRLRGRQKILRGATEVSVVGSQFQVDALLKLQAGVSIAVEVVDSHDVSGFKFLALLQEQILVVRIDAKLVRKAMKSIRPTTEGLKNLIRGFGGWQSWPTLHDPPEQTELPFRIQTEDPSSDFTACWLKSLVKSAFRPWSDMGGTGSGLGRGGVTPSALVRVT